MLKDDPAHDSLIRWTHVVGVGFDNLEPRDFEPLLGFGVSLSAMDVYRFVPFIGVKKNRQPRIIRIVGQSFAPLFPLTLCHPPDTKSRPMFPGTRSMLRNSFGR
jgi:hypothetical protein